jgi:hypothetical protein
MAKAVPNPLPPDEEEQQRQWWDFDQDGDEAAGTFIRAGQGHTRLGNKKPFLELEIAGRPRSVWLHHKAAISKIQERIKEHGPIEPGERLVIRRSREKKVSFDGYEYYPYQVDFPDLPQPDQYDLFGVGRQGDELKAEDKPDGESRGGDFDDDIPFS